MMRLLVCRHGTIETRPYSVSRFLNIRNIIRDSPSVKMLEAGTLPLRQTSNATPTRSVLFGQFAECGSYSLVCIVHTLQFVDLLWVVVDEITHCFVCCGIPTTEHVDTGKSKSLH